jgi:RNA polymerase sigma-70 factor (TIGR02957 family)
VADPAGGSDADEPDADEPDDAALARFVELRPLLFTVAYEMLGSAADADDVLQEAWLRWAAVDPGTVRDPRAYLVRVVTRQALNRLRTLSRRREAYVGPWLPEPIATTPDVADDVELAESVSMAMLVVLETLSPLERAVFVLREVFGFEYAEVAEAVGRSPAAVRQLAHRSRQHVEARRQRPRPEELVDTRVVMERFFHAAVGGDLQALLDVLSPDVVLLSDGGGKVSAALRPVVGADKVARFTQAIAQTAYDAEVVWLEVNGAPGALFSLEGEPVVAVSVQVRDGRIVGLYFVRNPDKLGRLSHARRLARRV